MLIPQLHSPGLLAPGFVMRGEQHPPSMCSLFKDRKKHLEGLLNSLISIIDHQGGQVEPFLEIKKHLS